MSDALFHRLIASAALPEAPLLRASLLAMLCLLYVSGFRKAELIAYLPDRATLSELAHTCLAPLGDRRCCDQAPHAAATASPRSEVWGDRPVALAYLDVPGNAAKALAHLELQFPVEAGARESAPLLAADNATPLTPSHADKLLASLLAD
eukprot:4699976-Pleurochrysis_carterae.AAC.1